MYLCRIYIYHQTLPLHSLVCIVCDDDVCVCVCVCLTRRSLYYRETKLTIVPIESTNPCRVLDVAVEPFKFEGEI